MDTFEESKKALKGYMLDEFIKEGANQLTNVSLTKGERFFLKPDISQLQFAVGYVLGLVELPLLFSYTSRIVQVGYGKSGNGCRCLRALLQWQGPTPGDHLLWKSELPEQNHSPQW